MKPKDPIAEAWKQLNKAPFPKVLEQSPIQLAGTAQAYAGKRRGKHLLAVCASLVLGIGLAQASTITVNWVAPTQNVDGSAITAALTYNVLWGPSGGPYTQIDNAVTASGVKETVDFTKGSCVVVVAVEPAPAIPSAYSAPFCFPAQPKSPTSVTATVVTP